MTGLTVSGGHLLGPTGRLPGDVVLADGRIHEVRDAASPAAGDDDVDRDERIDATGLLVAPGYVDLQCNGALGIDLTSEPERLWEVAAILPRWGVTAWLPTVITSPPGTVERALDALAAGPPVGLDGPFARPLGLHAEGPYLSPERPGAHPARFLRAPDLGEIDGWSADAGMAMVTLAPELEGAGALVEALVERGIVVSAGHSDATAEQALAAIDRGVRFVTHLFNAMAPLHHRAPGLAGAALADRRVHVGVIADGVHVHPTAVAAAHRALRSRLVLVTDATAALGLDPGDSRLGDAPVVVGDDGSVRLPDGTLAGSALSMDRSVRNLAAWTGCGVAGAVAAATAGPAAALGRDDIGVLRPGAPADLVLLTEDLEVVTTIVAGAVVRP